MSYNRPYAEWGFGPTRDLELRDQSGLKLGQQASLSKKTSGRMAGDRGGRIRPLETHRDTSDQFPQDASAPRKQVPPAPPCPGGGAPHRQNIKQTWASPAAEPPDMVTPSRT